MLISCIIPTHNRLATLPRAVDSILRQTHQELELWVVDDASTDQTAEYLRELQDARVHVFTLAENLGVSRARNLAAAKARGEWLAFLDSDDEWLPDKLERQLAVIAQNNELHLVHGEEQWVRRGVRVNQKKHHRKGGGDQFARATELCVISPSAAMIRTRIFHELGGFREDFVVCEDYDLWLRFLCRHPVGFVGEPIVVKYGGHEDQLSARYKAMDDWRLRSLLHLLEHEPLNREQAQVALEQLCRKGQILLIGYDKHNRPEDCQRVQGMIDRAHDLFKQRF